MMRPLSSHPCIVDTFRHTSVPLLLTTNLATRFFASIKRAIRRSPPPHPVAASSIYIYMYTMISTRTNSDVFSGTWLTHTKKRRYTFFASLHIHIYIIYALKIDTSNTQSEETYSNIYSWQRVNFSEPTSRYLSLNALSHRKNEKREKKNGYVSS